MPLHDSNRSRLRNETKKKKEKRKKEEKKIRTDCCFLHETIVGVVRIRWESSIGRADITRKTKRDGGISNGEYRIGSNRGRVAAYVARTKSQWTIVDGGETILPTVGIYVVRHASNRYTINGISCVGNAPNGSSLFNALSDVYIYIYIYRNRSTRRCLCADGNEPREISLSPESRVASKAVRARGDDSINGGEHPSSIQGVNIYPMAGDLGGGGKGRRAAG